MKKAKGNTLIYALFIVLIISILLNFIILISQYSSQITLSYKNQIQEIRNIESGITLLLNTPIIPINKQKEITLFDGNKVYIERYGWGVFEIIGAHNSTIHKYALTGVTPPDTTLYISNTRSTLNVAGTTYIQGNCFLPKSKVERANISGLPYTGEHLIYGNKKESNKTIPEINSYLLENTNSPIYYKKDSIVYFNNQTNITHPFKKKTIHYKSTKSIILNNHVLQGNIVIESEQSIIIKENVKLKNIILIAPYIEIQNKYKNEDGIQIIAQDSIFIGENVTLGYPSALFLYNNNKTSSPPPNIKIKKNFILLGDIIAYQNIYDYRNPINVIIENNANIIGTIYTNGITYISNSKINGSLYCNYINNKKDGNTYYNTIINTLISSKNRPKNFVGSPIIKTNNSKRIIEWL